jgi:hypothetical protein
MKAIQLEFQFDNSKISPGCKPYHSEFPTLRGDEEICKGGAVFLAGQKENCMECAKTCNGCVEMTINLGCSDFDEIKHLIRDPLILSNKYWNLWVKYMASKQGKINTDNQ